MNPVRYRLSLSRCASIILAAAFTLSLTGCATTTSSRTGRLHNSAHREISAIQTTAVVPPTIILNQLTAGGVKEQRDDWTNTARQAARETLESLRPERIVYLRDTELAPEVAAEVVEVQALYRTVDMNLALFGHPMVGLPTMAGRFDFSVGSVDRICEAVGADALLLVFGEDDYFTSDRKAVAALGMVAAAFTGVYIQPSSGTEHLSAALVARDGTILWYDVLGPGMIGDLRKPEGVKATIENLLRSMPATGGASS